jgi:hypothetical protein
MTKKLEDMLNLPDNKDLNEEENIAPVVEHEDTFRDIAEFDKISDALPAVKGLGDMADKELNEVANKAMTAYDDLMDLGMNFESRYSGRVFEVAGTMLKTSLDAKVAKLDKKLKMVELQLKKEKMDRDSGPGGDGDIVNGEGYVVSDRNSLLERLKGIDKDK